jgi:hypothetical protein
LPPQSCPGLLSLPKQIFSLNAIHEKTYHQLICLSYLRFWRDELSPELGQLGLQHTQMARSGLVLLGPLLTKRFLIFSFLLKEDENSHNN